MNMDNMALGSVGPGTNRLATVGSGGMLRLKPFPYTFIGNERTNMYHVVVGGRISARAAPARVVPAR